MVNFKLLDCTLREAPLDRLLWGELFTHKVIRGLENAGINIIEIGFLKDCTYEPGSTCFSCVEDIEPYLLNKKADVMYVALVDYGRFDLSNLSDYDGRTIDAIRICFKHNEIEDVLDYASQIRAKGYKVCIQHVDTMGYQDEEIVKFVRKVNEFKPFSYSIVDTFGAMYSKDVMHYADIINRELDEDIWMGLHTHNNMMLADANAQLYTDELIGKRKIIVDTSLYGCGRSAGNAHTELMTTYMNKNHEFQYDINEVLDLIDTVITAAQKKTTWGYSIPYFISGMYNAHTFNVNQLLKRHNIKSKDLRAIMGMLDEKQKKAYDYVLLEKLYVQYFDNPVDDEAVLNELTEAFSGREILLLGPGASIKDNCEKIHQFISVTKPIVVGVNNVIDGFCLDYIFYSGSIRYDNLKYQTHKLTRLPKLIVTSNIKVEADINEYIVNYNSLIKYGWINMDSSIILLMRLMIKCQVRKMYMAGLDGYTGSGDAFYDNELDTNMNATDRVEHTNDNISMMKDILADNKDLQVRFLTASIYEEVFQ